MIRIILLAALILLVHIYASGQCGECKKRSVMQYDIVLEIADPSQSGVPLDTYINMLKISEALSLFLKTADLNMDCIGFNFLVPHQDIDSANYMWVFLGQNYPDNASAHDYYISGSISGTPGSYLAQAYMAVGATGEWVCHGEAAFSDGFDPLDVAGQIGMDMISMFTKIMNFEKDVRDMDGQPYAITPTISMEPEENQLDFNEQTVVHIRAIDCDGEPLKQRTIDLSVEGGFLDNYQVTTDAAGESFVMFTAGNEPVIAVVQTDFSYKTASEKVFSAEVEPAFIQIKKPEDAWLITGKYQVTHEYKYADSSSVPGYLFVQEGRNHTNQRMHFATWVKRYPVSADTMIFALTSDPPLAMKSKALELTLGWGTILQSGINWYQNECTFHNHASRNISGEAPQFSASVGEGYYDFSLDVFSFYDEHNRIILDAYDPEQGRTHEEQNDWDDGETWQSFSIQDVSRDTSYTFTEFEPVSQILTSKTVEQSFSWDNRFCNLQYSSSLLIDQDMEMYGIKTKNTDLTSTKLKISMSYNGNESSSVGNIMPQKPDLLQNHPNPVSSSTTIGFIMSDRRYVRLEIFDVLGNRLKTLFEGFADPGFHSVKCDVESLRAGIYFYRLTVDGFTESRKMIVQP